MNNSKYCVDLQNGLWFQFDTMTNSYYARPCCYYKKIFPVKNNIQEEFWNNPIIQQERADNLAGKELSQNCKTCKDSEARGLYSRRQSFNDRMDESWLNSDSVVLLDVMADFTCNLACRICGPNLSTTWRLVEKSTTVNKEYLKNLKVRAKNNDVIQLLSTMPMHNIKQIHFQGGEPFLTNTHTDIIEKLESTVNLSQISLWYHSNGTVPVSDRVLKLWEKCKFVEIYFSLDDMGKRMEYQRWPMSWENTVKNLEWFQQNLPHTGMIRIERTVGILNLAWIQELDRWASNDFYQTKYGDAITINYHDCAGTYSLDAITREYKDYALKNIPTDHWAYKRILNIPVDNEAAIKKLLGTLNIQDGKRNESWQKTYPEFLDWYKRYL